MRGFICFCFMALTAVKGAPQGYNYPQQQSFNPSFTSSAASAYGSSGSGYSADSFGSYPNQLNSHVSQPAEPIVTKRFFIHSAPEESEEEGQTKTITVGSPRKNYNVVFIRAPSKGQKKTKINIIPAVNEDKTVIYVLAKKSEAAEIQTEVQEVAAPTAKPEVFFIKYKTNEEAYHAQKQIQSQYDKLGGSSLVSDEGVAPVRSVIGSLGENHSASASASASATAGSTGFGYALPTGGSNNGYLPPHYYKV